MPIGVAMPSAWRGIHIRQVHGDLTVAESVDCVPVEDLSYDFRCLQVHFHRRRLISVGSNASVTVGHPSTDRPSLPCQKQPAPPGALGNPGPLVLSDHPPASGPTAAARGFRPAGI